MLHKIAVIAGIALLLPAAHAQAAPCAGFTDVDSSSPFCTHVAWLKNRGITLGCTSATTFCPGDYVTRLQMAVFLYRLGYQNAFLQGGNAFGTTATLGTTDSHAVELVADDARVMRYEPGTISPNVIGGSPANSVTAGVRGATIAGGGVPAADLDPVFDDEGPNVVTDVYGTVGGGYANRVGDGAGTVENAAFATVAGGLLNAASGAQSSVGGGGRNTASGVISTVAGGDYNTASAVLGAIGGGHNNSAIGYGATVGGGLNNIAGETTATASTVSGGNFNIASGGLSFVGGGQVNTATGFGSMIPGGERNTAGGSFTFAAGRRAKATKQGTFMWADSRDFDFIDSVPNFFGVRATGGMGVTVAIDPTTGGVVQYCNYLPGYSGWSCTSDRDAKENFVAVNGADILAKLVAMPLFSWNYKGADPALRMLGPTAQDFDAAFALGNADKTIASGNLDGVALAAIQGLNAKLESSLADVAALRAELAEMRELRAELASLRAELRERLASGER